MLDIVEIQDGKDIGVADSVVSKAANVISTQIQTLEYAMDFGVDLKFFLSSEIQFQNQSFQSYLTQRLIEHQINVTSIQEQLETLFARYTYFVGDANQDARGLIK